MVLRQRDALKLSAVVVAAEAAVKLFLKNPDCFFLNQPVFHWTYFPVSEDVA